MQLHRRRAHRHRLGRDASAPGARAAGTARSTCPRGDHHRFYAIPTGTDTILAITWDSDLAATDKLVESMTFP